MPGQERRGWIAWQSSVELYKQREDVAAEGRLHQDWPIDEAVDLLVMCTSVETYEQLVVQRGWSAELLKQRTNEICRTNLLAARR